MLTLRPAAAALLLLLAGTTFSCKKDDAAPVVGDLEVTLTYPSAYRTLNYAVYTEIGWAGPNTTGPLQQGSMGSSTSIAGGRYQSGLALRDLNPGNYVLTIGGISPKSVQVTAGRTNTYTLDF
ncbi:MAG: hypothetical protein ACRYFZ_07135 [Janthinobacterium lividum]